MYNDEDLQSAVEHNIFSSSAVEQFKEHTAKNRGTALADEENFRLISGFNDIFVVIASGLLLVSTAWLGFSLVPVLGAAAMAVVSWLLAEFFVIKRKMALPAIVLLITFLGGVFAVPLMVNEHPSEAAFLISGILTTIAALGHWRRFRVPITVAASVVAICGSLVAIILGMYPTMLVWTNSLLLVAGLIVFGLAMYWDATDRTRQTRASDVAFWLHLVAAPMIVHPIFSTLGVLGGVGDVYLSLAVLGLYILLAVISIAVDRRAIMVSALVYVIYAFSTILENYGMVSYSFAVTGMCIGTTLLLLSAFWQVSRKHVVSRLPATIQQFLPTAVH
ncbi:hypothetical protein [Aliiglaciecola litoralis]|uniref:DUF2157 domain-containing protein n=1 Tax=Aliiglaciecola litoralis TaxID=582857 RepID=A0ABN1LSP4_9ALTE